MRIFSKCIVAAFIITALPHTVKSHTTEGLNSLAQQPTAKTSSFIANPDTGELSTEPWLDSLFAYTTNEENMYEQRLKGHEDSIKAYEDHLKAEYPITCERIDNDFLADLARIDKFCAGYLKNQSNNEFPKSEYFSLLTDDSSTVLNLYFNGTCEHTSEPWWDSESPCRPNQFDFKKYKNFQKCIERGYIYVGNAERAQYDATLIAIMRKRCDDLLKHINVTLLWAQKQPKFKAKKLPSPEEYAEMEEGYHYTSLPQFIEHRKNYIAFLNSKLKP